MSKKNESKKTNSPPKGPYDEVDFVTCVDLNNLTFDCVEDGVKKTKTVYHGVYASMLYGTVFCIYGKFTKVPGNVDPVLISDVELRLLNYKGLINIGFPVTELTVDVTDPENMIPFEVQGAAPNLMMKITFTEPIPVHKHQFKRLTFTRVLRSLPNFAVVKHTKLDDVTEPRGSQVPTSAIFDTEFHYRDGVDYYDQPVRSGMDGYEAPVPFFSLRCVQGIVNVANF